MTPNFCEKIYPDDFKVVKDEQMCMTFDFSAHENPNAKVSSSVLMQNICKVVPGQVVITMVQ